jgi:hypothetical protein
MRRIVMLAALALACGEDVNDWPDVETLYRLDAAGPVCVGPVGEWSDEDAHHCSWERVKVGGEPRCWAVVDFHQATPGSPWTVANTWTTRASCD